MSSRDCSCWSPILSRCQKSVLWLVSIILYLENDPTRKVNPMYRSSWPSRITRWNSPDLRGYFQDRHALYECSSSDDRIVFQGNLKCWISCGLWGQVKVLYYWLWSNTIAGQASIQSSLAISPIESKRGVNMSKTDVLAVAAIRAITGRIIWIDRMTNCSFHRSIHDRQSSITDHFDESVVLMIWIWESWMCMLVNFG